MKNKGYVGWIEMSIVNRYQTRGIAPDFWHKEDWKDGRLEG